MPFDKVAALADVGEVLARTYNHEHGVVNEAQQTAALDACIDRYAGKDSAYRARATYYKSQIHNYGEGWVINGLTGILKTLWQDLDRGLLQSIESRISADVFADLLGQADFLVSGNYLLGAGVIAGAALEEHVRRLCGIFQISLVGSDGRPISANTMNVELKKAGLYGELQRSQVEAWQKVRNAAAHNLDEFKQETEASIARYISGIREFILNYPL